MPLSNCKKCPKTQKKSTNICTVPQKVIILYSQTSNTGKSCTACSLGIPPGLDRSKGTWL